MKPLCQAVFKKIYGGWALYLRVKPVEPTPNRDRSRYVMADINEILDMEVMCDGVSVKPRLILKLYCKLGEFKRNSAVNRAALDRARSGSPMLH